MWHINAVEHYSATKRNEILIDAMAWMDATNIMLSEICQTQKTNMASFHLDKVARISKFIESTIEVTKGRGEVWA
jgi:hypothetical protein